MLEEECRRVLDENTVQYGDITFTKPAKGHYDYLWLWDSCFHALMWSYFDIGRAEKEMDAIFAKQMPGGMLGHMVCFDPEEAKTPYHSPNGGVFRLWNDTGTSNLTQPPVLGSALLRIHEITKSERILFRNFDRALGYYRALRDERDPDSDGLVSIIHPWESGWDNSPRWDRVYGIKDPSVETLNDLKLKLINEYWGKKWNAKEASFSVESADFNAIYAKSLRDLAKIASIIGREEEEELLRTAEKCEGAIERKLWHKDGYYDICGKDENRILVRTPAIFFPLYAGIPDHERAEVLIETYREFEVPYPIPSLCPGDPSFDPDSYWRGSTWMNVNWFLYRGFLKYGFENEAKGILKSSIELVENEGFREYYNPYTGKGLGAMNFSWSALVLDMVCLKL